MKEKIKLLEFINTNEYFEIKNTINKCLEKIDDEVQNWLKNRNYQNFLKKTNLSYGIYHSDRQCIYFGITYLFYSEGYEILNANCLNINYIINELQNQTYLELSIDSIHEDIVLLKLQNEYIEKNKIIDFKSEVLSRFIILLNDFIEKSKNNY